MSTEIASARAAELGMEIRVIIRQTQEIVARNMIEIGRRLTEAKEKEVPHGEWGDWLKREVNFSQSTANDYMRVYERFGKENVSFFGPSDRVLEEINGLPYTKVLKLVAVPEGELESFMQEVDVESMSTRELEKEIKARKQAEQAAEQAQKAVAATQELMAAQQEKSAEQESKLDAMQKEAEAAERKRAALQKELSTMQSKLDAAQKELEAEKQKEKTVPADVMERMRREADRAAAEKAAEQAKKEVAAAQDRAEKSEKEAAELREKLEAAQREQKTADGEIAAFKVIFQQVQEDFNKLGGAMMKVQARSPEQGEKLKAAVKALVKAMEGKLCTS